MIRSLLERAARQGARLSVVMALGSAVSIYLALLPVAHGFRDGRGPMGK